MINEFDFESLKPGDKVKIVDAWLPKEDEDGAWGPCNENEEGEMDHWLGKVMTVREVSNFSNDVRMVEDIHEGIYTDGWYWNRYCIDEILGKETAIGLEELI